jgi:hypothetical protein
MGLSAGLQWRSSLKHCATSRIFHSLNRSGRTISLGLTQPQAEINTWDVSWWEGKGGRCVGLTTLPPSRADCLEVPGALRGLSRPVMG